MEFNKLVREKIPQIIEKNGETVIMHIADDAEYEKAPENKIYEEISEFLKEPSLE